MPTWLIVTGWSIWLLWLIHVISSFRAFCRRMDRFEMMGLPRSFAEVPPGEALISFWGLLASLPWFAWNIFG